MASEKEVIAEIVKLVSEGSNPREVRIAINRKFPDWNDRNKLKRITPKILKQFPAIRKTALRITDYFKIFLIGSDDIRARGKKFTQKF
ncbi:MAG: hypothetical protein ACFFD2_04760 [Promethearchaeota archaeon]